MSAFTTIGIHYNFSSGQSGITMWTTDYKLAGRINIQHEIILDQLIKLNNFGFHTGNKDVFHIVVNNSKHFLVCLLLRFGISGLNKFVVLGGNHNGVNFFGLIVIIVLNGNLRLGIGTKIGHHFAFATNISQLFDQCM